MKQKPTVSEQEIYSSHKENYWEFSNTGNRREVVRRYNRRKYAYEQARSQFVNCIYSYPLETRK